MEGVLSIRYIIYLNYWLIVVQEPLLINNTHKLWKSVTISELEIA